MFTVKRCIGADDHGFTLIEVMVALMLATMLGTMLLAMTIMTQQQLRAYEARTDANRETIAFDATFQAAFNTAKRVRLIGSANVGADVRNQLLFDFTDGNGNCAAIAVTHLYGKPVATAPAAIDYMNWVTGYYQKNGVNVATCTDTALNGAAVVAWSSNRWQPRPITFNFFDALGVDITPGTATGWDVANYDQPVNNLIAKIQYTRQRNTVGAATITSTYALGPDGNGGNGGNGAGAPPVTTFEFTGAVQTYTVPAGVTSVTLEAWGAQGGDGQPNGAADGGYGGYSKGMLVVAPGAVLNVYVGGSPPGGVKAGGWNGGGQGVGEQVTNGGDGTDVRLGGTALSNRVIVAGGGGGGSSYGYPGGGGGGATGVTPVEYKGAGWGVGGTGGTQTTGYALGTGQGGSWSAGVLYGTGGGGYWGGWASLRGGGGGSGYVGGVTSSSMLTGVRTGNGQVVITPVG